MRLRLIRMVSLSVGVWRKASCSSMQLTLAVAESMVNWLAGSTLSLK